MTPIQQLMLGVGAKKKTYMDDLFSTYLYTGTGSARSINNGIDMSEGGMTWIKNRSGTSSTWYHVLADSVRGSSKILRSNGTNAEYTNTNALTSFNNNGFSLGSAVEVNDHNDDRKYASWTFRKAPGFFDVVSYTGNGGGARSINHNLGSIPGFVALKSTSNITNWVCYHKDFSSNEYNSLNSDAAAATDANQSINSVTSTQFTVGSDQNTNGLTFVVYLWAGGESTNALARSVDFDGSDDEIFENSTGSVLRNWFDQAFTVEYWVKADALASGDGGGTNAVGVSTLGTSNLSWSFGPNNTGQIRFSYWNGSNESTILPSETIKVGQWYHLAFVHDGSNNCKIFINGSLGKEATISNGTANAGDMVIGQVQSTQFNGKVSNLRITHQALYTTSFRPPTEPLTTTSQGATASNVKLLCCNNSSVTGNTVSPSGMNNNGSPTASTDSPFDDPAGFVFGDAEDQNVIKCGSYVGNESTDGPEINLGWEPQWVLVKNADSAVNWRLQDSMRGIVTGGNDPELEPNTSSEADTGQNRIDLTPTGFKVVTESSTHNNNGHKYVYICIRRPDGYVGKPYGAGEGTSVFAMDTGNSTTSGPNFDGNFPVDFGLFKSPADSDDWRAGARLLGTKYVETNNTDAEANLTNLLWDYNDGWAGDGLGSDFQGWGWKRHAGFDVVTYRGNGVIGYQVPHSMNKAPEMMWVRQRDASTDGTWWVWHKGLNNGNPGTYFMKLNTDAAESEYNLFYAAPTSRSFSLYNYSGINSGTKDYIAFLFASVDGISKVGYYTGDGASDGSNAITVGFQPRFLIIKRVDSTGNWNQFDTVRGLGAGVNTLSLNLNDYHGQTNQGSGKIGLSSTTFIPGSGGEAGWNTNSAKYIYYAHA